MSTNYLSNLNNSIKINSSVISNSENRNSLVALSRRNANDLNRLADYINSILVPSLSSLASKPRYPYDTVESGLSGLTMITYPEAQGNNKFNSELYWKLGATEETGRPCTIKESFDFLLVNMIDRVVEVRESVANLNPLLDQIGCIGNNNLRLAKDVFGSSYAGTFNCNSSPVKTYSLAEHIYQIINQLTGNPSGVATELNTNSSGYPTLNVQSPFATYAQSGDVEIATAAEVAAGTVTGSSAANLVVSAADLLDGIEVASGSLRTKIKAAALEKINESSINELSDVDTSTAAPQNNDSLVWNGSKWVPGGLSGDKISEGDSSVEVIDISNASANIEFKVNNITHTKMRNGVIVPGTDDAIDIGEANLKYHAIYLGSTDDAVNNPPTYNGGLHLNGNRISTDSSNKLKYNTANFIPHYTGNAVSNNYLKHDGSNWTLGDLSDLTPTQTFTQMYSNEWPATYSFDHLDSSFSVSANDKLYLNQWLTENHHTGGAGSVLFQNGGRENLIFRFSNLNGSKALTITDWSLSCDWYDDGATLEVVLWKATHAEMYDASGPYINAITGALSIPFDGAISTASLSMYPRSGTLTQTNKSFTVEAGNYFGIAIVGIGKNNAVNKHFHCTIKASTGS